MPMKQKPCRIWRSAVNTNGYAVMKYQGRLELVTRILLTLKLGRTLKRGMEAAHTCHRRRCVEPSHLVEKTHRQNCNMGNMRRAG